MKFINILSGLFLLFLSQHVISAAQNPNRDNRFDTQFVYESRVSIDINRATVGNSKYGERGLMWITGGTVKGPKIQAKVLPGGGDWQLSRADGGQELQARYAIKTQDGFIILVHNNALVIPNSVNDSANSSYTRSVLSFEAPIDSPYDWMNKAIFLGTVEPADNFEKDPGVIIRVWKLL